MKQLLQNHIPKPIGSFSYYAILIPLIKIQEKWHLVYQVRSSLIPQPGEVSFPGGKQMEGEHLQETAVRETCEELGIKPEHIELLGELDYLVQANRCIHCYLGILHLSELGDITPNAQEVARIFTVPLDDVLRQEPTYYPLQLEVQNSPDFPFAKIPHGIHYPFKEKKLAIPFYEIAEETIWGITALFTHSLARIYNQQPLDSTVYDN